MPRKKAVLIGINYYGTDSELGGSLNDVAKIKEFLVEDRGWPDDPDSMYLLTDEPDNEGTEYWPNMENIKAAFQWLVEGNEDGDACWLSYGGHGGQAEDLEGERESGYDDTICPVDFEEAGQITSDELHRLIVSPMNPAARLTIFFDCCHSGSACELPFVYRPDADGNVHHVNTVKKGVELVGAAHKLLKGGVANPSAVKEAKRLLGGATELFKSLKHRSNVDEDGLAKEYFEESWEDENKDVWMFSGCRDDQESADAEIDGEWGGPMCAAFLQALRENPRTSYIELLKSIRAALVDEYSQIPQLSCGGRRDLDQEVQL